MMFWLKYNENLASHGNIVDKEYFQLSQKAVLILFTKTQQRVVS